MAKHTIKNKRFLKSMYKNNCIFHPLDVKMDKPIAPYTNYRVERGFNGYWVINTNTGDVLFVLNSKLIHILSKSAR
jgi:hypothetical protein